MVLEVGTCESYSFIPSLSDKSFGKSGDIKKEPDGTPKEPSGLLRPLKIPVSLVHRYLSVSSTINLSRSGLHSIHAQAVMNFNTRGKT